MLKKLLNIEQAVARSAKSMAFDVKVRGEEAAVQTLDSLERRLKAMTGKGLNIPAPSVGGTVQGEVLRLAQAMEDLTAAISAVGGRIRTVRTDLKALDPEAVQTARSIENLVKSFRNGEVEAAPFVAAMTALIAKARELRSYEQSNSTRGYGLLTGAIGTGQEALGTPRLASGPSAQSTAELRAQIKSLTTEAQGLRAAFQNDNIETAAFVVRAKQLRAEMLALATTLPKNSQEFSSLQVRARLLSSALTNLKNEMPRLGIASQVRQSLGETNSLLKGLTGGLVFLPGPIGTVVNSLVSLETAFAGAGAAAGGLSTKLLLPLGGLALFGVGIGATIKPAAEFQKALSQIEAISHLPEDQLHTLGNRFKQLSIDTNTSLETLTEFARKAVTLGIHDAQGMATYVDTMARLKVVLRDVTGHTEDFNRTQEELVAILRLTDSKDINADLLTLGNSMVALKTEFGAAIPQIAQIATYFAASAVSAGVSREQIVAISAALAQVQAKPQGAGNSLQRFFADIQKAAYDTTGKTQAWAEVLGLTVDQFKEMVHTNPAGVLTLFAKALYEGNTRGIPYAITLDKLGIKTQAYVRAAADLANAHEPLARAQELASKGAENQTLLSETAAHALNNYQDSVGELGKAFKALLTDLGTDFLPVLTGVVKGVTLVVGGVDHLVQVFNLLPEPIRQVFVIGGTLVGGLLLINKTVATTRAVLGGLATSFKTLAGAEAIEAATRALTGANTGLGAFASKASLVSKANTAKSFAGGADAFGTALLNSGGFGYGLGPKTATFSKSLTSSAKEAAAAESTFARLFKTLNTPVTFASTMSVITKGLGGIKSAGLAAGTGIVNGLRTAMTFIFSAAGGIAALATLALGAAVGLTLWANKIATDTSAIYQKIADDDKKLRDQIGSPERNASLDKIVALGQTRGELQTQLQAAQARGDSEQKQHHGIQRGRGGPGARGQRGGGQPAAAHRSHEHCHL